MTKNELIKQTLKETKLRRKSQTLKVYELKVQMNHISKKTKKILHRTFLETKWFYNSSLNDIFNVSYKTKKVTVKVFNPLTGICDLNEQRELTLLGSQVKEAILNRLKTNIFNLSKAKNKVKIGSLKPKSEINSIPFIRYNTTHWIRGNKIKLQGLPKLKINGLNQIKEAEPANAFLIRKPSGYYVKLTCFLPKKTERTSGSPIGLDFGIKDSITLSNNESFDFKIPLTKNIKRKQSLASKKQKRSKNKWKALHQFKKTFEHYTNKKQDSCNKFIHKLKEHSLIVYQNENIKGWHMGLFGRQIQLGILGRIKTALKRVETSKMISRSVPTTQLCPKCQCLHKQDLDVRDYSCSCGYYHLSRDTKAALTALTWYVCSLTPPEQRSLLGEDVSSTSFFQLFQLLEKKQDTLITQEAH